MPQDGNNQERGSFQMSAEEYRRMQAARAARRKKRQQQRLLVLGAFVLAAILLVVAIVMVVRSIVKKKDDSSTKPDSSVSTLANQEEFTPNYPTAADPGVWNLKLVNENNPLPAGFEVDFEWGEVVVNSGNTAVTYYFDARIVDALNEMIADCNAVEGNSLAVGSGFRSYDRQQKYFEYEVTLGNSEDEVKKYESTAGASDHHTGLAVKFITDNVSEFSDTFSTTPEYEWLMENAENYGFILRYPGAKEAITGMSYMPYHWRYVGSEEAKAMNAAGVCLEEYVSAVSPSAMAGATMPDDPDPDANNEGGEGDAPEGDGSEGEGGGDGSDAGEDAA